MAKRAAPRDSLTGGTADVSPQLLSINLAQTVANTYAEASIAIPQSRFASNPTEAVVIEILKVFWNLGEPDTNPSAAGNLISIQANLSTRSSATLLGFGNPTVIDMSEKTVRGAFTAAGSYGMLGFEPQIHDLTDGAGHGVLVATDLLFVGVNTANFVAVSSVNLKVLYRFKRIGLAEYIGIVQAQS